VESERISEGERNSASERSSQRERKSDVQRRGFYWVKSCLRSTMSFKYKYPLTFPSLAISVQIQIFYDTKFKNLTISNPSRTLSAYLKKIQTQT
jgi:hypothetical protein